MYAMCVNNEHVRASFTVTIGKVYNIISESDNLYTVINDFNHVMEYAKYRFIVIKDNKINKLLHKELK